MCLVGLGSTTHYRLVFVAPAAVTGATALAALRARHPGTVAARLKVVAIVGLWPAFGRIPSIPAIVVAAPALGGVWTTPVVFSFVNHFRRMVGTQNRYLPAAPFQTSFGRILAVSGIGAVLFTLWGILTTTTALHVRKFFRKPLGRLRTRP